MVWRARQDSNLQPSSMRRVPLGPPSTQHRIGSVEKSAFAKPGLDVATVLGDFFALDGEAGADLGSGAGGGVDVFGAAEAADGVGDEGVDFDAGESWASANVVMIIGGRVFQIGLPSRTCR